MVVPYRRFGITYRFHFQVILALSGNILVMIGENLWFNLKCILGISGNSLPTFRNKSIYHTFKGFIALICSLVPKFRENILAPFSIVFSSLVPIPYGRVGITYRSHLHG